jgi:hypothetical protein
VLVSLRLHSPLSTAAEQRSSGRWTGLPQVTSHIPIVLGSGPTDAGAVHIILVPPYGEKNVSFSGKKPHSFFVDALS